MIRHQGIIDTTAPFDTPVCTQPKDAEMPAHVSHRELLRLLKTAADREASDLHLVPGYPASLRIHGRIVAIDDTPLDEDHVKRMAASILSAPVLATFPQQKNADCSVSFEHDGHRLRFRANVYVAREAWCICLRHIPTATPTLEWLGFPRELAERLVSYINGLVVVAGETGAGKSSTLAALIDLVRESRDGHVLTIEEPIEYIYPADGRCVVTQREVGRDVASFADGLKYGLRQDPDVILVGEIRDRETAQMALSAAETGHLILTTMHTRDAKGAISRLVDLFPPETQDDLRRQLALSLRAVVSQRLLPPALDGQRRALAMEVLHVTQQVQIAIRSGRLETIDSSLQTGIKGGMVSLDDDLRRLVREGKISVETARRYAKDPEALNAVGRSW
ncbi:MAG: PilT/PilU family type 4a pilus ATPase [Phycisphaerae bacterium]|jgi:twitching motility protein PilT